MVEHASEYPWSSFRCNAVGKHIELLSPHPVYLNLGKDLESRLTNYRSIFRGRMSEKTLKEIRDATNKGWVLGSDKFKNQIEKVTGRNCAPCTRGGDRKSEAYKKRNQ